MNIDVHNHAIPQRVLDLVEREPGYGVSLEGGIWHGPNIGDFDLVEAWASPDGKLRELDKKGLDRKSTRLNSSHGIGSRMPSSA